jgi:hypothetical protein
MWRQNPNVVARQRALTIVVEIEKGEREHKSNKLFKAHLHNEAVWMGLFILGRSHFCGKFLTDTLNM